MQVFAALIRGINVGKDNKLPMAELIAICKKIGCKNVRTYIQSGNVIFESALSEASLTKKLEAEIEKYMKRPVLVMVRTEKEMESVLKQNPFPKAKPAQVGVTFFKDPIPRNTLKGWMNTEPEEVKVGKRELYVHYPNGMGRSKLKLPKFTSEGTVRNINTVAKLVALAEGKSISRS